jgi:hypothetical protein
MYGANMHRLRACGLVGLVLFFAGCQANPASSQLPATIIAAPPGGVFLLQDAVGKPQSAAQISLTVNDAGELVANGNLVIPSATVIPPEARFLHVAEDGTLAIRTSQQPEYVPIGMLHVGIWNKEVLEQEIVTPGQRGVPPMVPALFAIIRQGEKIMLVPVGTGV